MTVPRLRRPQVGLTLGAALIIGALSACGSNDSKSELSPAASKAAPIKAPAGSKAPYADEIPSGSNPAVKGKTIGLVSITQASELFPREEVAFKEAAAALGWSVETVDLKGDPSKAPAAVQNLIQSGVDGIVLESVEPIFLGPAAAQAKAKNVPIIATLVGTPASQAKGALFASVVEPLAEESVQLAERMIKDAGGGGDLAVDGDKISPVGVIPEKAMTEAVAGKMKIVAKHQIDYTKLAADANAVTQQWLVQYPSLKAIWCPYDGACVGAAQAVQAAGKDTGVYAFNGSEGTMELIRNGAKYVSMAAPVEYAAYLALDAFNSQFGGKQVDQDLVLHDQLTDKSNVPSSGVVDGTSLYGDFRAAYKKRWGVG
jgi:ABC-type sugar transport system substrate-binding protein